MYIQTDYNYIFCNNTQLIWCLYTLLYYHLGLLERSGGGTVSAWLGARGGGVDGTWVWLDGSPGIIFP